MKATVHHSIKTISPAAWNRLAGTTCPFLRHEFLSAAEQTGCATRGQGWTPRHLTLERDGKLVAAMPLYEKSHSWGEFVFDWAWAQAYERAGLAYYPKLVAAVPFTPATSRRLLVADGDDEAAAALLDAALAFARDEGYSSLHLLFPTEPEIARLRDAGFVIRKDCQFHWENRGYGNFDDFLDTFSSAKRKKARRDRRRVVESGIRFRRLHGADLDPETWAVVYPLIAGTFLMRGSLPYFNEAFFRTVSERLPDQVLVILAEKDDEPIAAAVFFETPERLWGRYWGSAGQYDALHFETCYYQGIEYCIETGKRAFEPGTQGEHKISRGFAPVSTGSAHWLAHPAFADAIGRYVDEEGRHVDRYIDAVASHTPFKKGRGDE